VDRRDLIFRELGLTRWVLRGKAVPAQDMPAASLQAAGPATAAAASDAQATRARSIAELDWPALKAAVASCTACPLHAKRTQAVFGVGDERADWLFVGDGPGAEAAERGAPFVGQAGRLLDNMLAAIGLRRGQ